MAKMGLRYSVNGDMLILHGAYGPLTGTDVRALDLRAGAALALCGLIAKGTTRVLDAWQIERGYVGFVEKINALGGKARWLG
jgi:UDP-N-acetylglucosamine 1-carboxyvinyltransferase